MINSLILYIVSNYKSVLIINIIIGPFVVARLFLHSSFGIDERICAASRFFLPYWWLRLCVLCLLVISPSSNSKY